MNPNTEPKTVPLGDAIEIISKYLYQELTSHLKEISAQNTPDPEYSTIILRDYLAKARKIICQLHCLTSWLKSASNMKSFTQSNELNMQLQSIKDSILMSQDALYFVHRDIYPKRRRMYETIVAKDILARRTYAFLPEAVTNVGSASPPALLHDATVVSDLDIFIRAKFHLDDSVQDVIRQHYKITNGRLIIQIPYMYELELTLCHLHESADWMILSVKCLVASHVSESFYGTYDRNSRDREFLEIVRHHSSPSLSISSDNTRERTTIRKFHKICEYYAMTVAIRMFYIQSVDMTKNIWKNYMEVDFYDVGETVYMTSKFWKGEISQ